MCVLKSVCKGNDQNKTNTTPKKVRCQCDYHYYIFGFISFIKSSVIKRLFALPVSRQFNTMDHLGTADAEEDSGSLTRLAPSPHSEAVAHEFKELSLQPNQYLPSLNERKNGECQNHCPPFPSTA